MVNTIKNKNYIKYLLIVLGILILGTTLIVNNTKIQVSYFEYENNKIPSNFDGFSICQISDLHNAEFGDNQSELIQLIEEIDPDIIVITGDLIDDEKYDLEIALELVDGISNLAPIYYVSGNHEAWSGNYDDIIVELSERGVHVLDNEYKTIEIADQSIAILGVIDPAFYSSELPDQTSYILSNLNKEIDSTEKFKLLLAHRPELFDVYVESKIDLVLSGHTHGGQIRIPFIGGLIAPDQGLFPEYDAGIFEEGKTTMYVSRGLGNSIITLRVNNNPELVNIVLRSI